MAQKFSRRAASMAVLAATFIFSNHSFADLTESRPGEFILELRREVNDENQQVISDSLGTAIIDRIRGNMVLVHLPKNAAQMVSRLREHPLVSRIEPNFIYRTVGQQVSKIPNDPEFSKTWGLQNTGAADKSGLVGIAGIDIGAVSAWNIETGSKAVVVAVIDTGVDFNHPDLKSQAWVNNKELNGKVGVDDDGNGFIDDIHGYDFVNNKGDSSDDFGHGTHCAGTIGAKGGDSQGLVGVNWDVSIMALKFLDKNGGGTLANAIKSIDYARLNGAKILNNSWGGGALSTLLGTAIEDAAKAGILFVVAAGNNSNNNDTTPTYPSNYEYENILSVAALNNRGIVAAFSNYGAKTVHVAAPGVEVVSTVLKGGYDSYSGTSMATPHVAGIAALLLANNTKLNAVQLKNRIMQSVRPLSTLKYRVSTSGIADAYYALSGLTPPGDPNDPANLPKVTPYVFATDHPYKNLSKLEHKIRIPGAKKLAIRFGLFETEAGYDSLSIFTNKGDFVTSISGTQPSGLLTPIIDGDTAILRFSSDETDTAYGFDVEAILSDQ